MWLSSSARRLHEPSPPTRLIIFIITDAVRSCPQTLHFYLERLATPRLLVLMVLSAQENTCICSTKPQPHPYVSVVMGVAQWWIEHCKLLSNLWKQLLSPESSFYTLPINPLVSKFSLCDADCYRTHSETFMFS